ncbi:MAG: hypothetical protein KKB51_22725 [Candidatus Riflebacteria bacterium]|nr:hypothetical protein [Candidatus Riflebacteria bacterium]
MRHFPRRDTSLTFGCGAIAHSRHLCCTLCVAFLLLVCMVFMAPPVVFAINAPTITHIDAKLVAPGETMYANTNTFEIRGNAEADTQIRLFSGATQVATGTTPATGEWSIPVTQAQGSYSYAALAYDGLFISELSGAVPVIVDTAGPGISIWYGNSGCRSNSLFQCQVGLLYAISSDSGAGVDFSTAQYTCDYAVMPTEGDPNLVVPVWSPVPGTISNDGSSQINFFPSDWSLVNNNYRKVRLTVTVSDFAGNTSSDVKTFFVHQTRMPGPTITHIKDVGVWRPYVSGMAVTDNPFSIRGVVTKSNELDKGWYSAYVGDNTFSRYRVYGVLNLADNTFEYTYVNVMPAGPITLAVSAGESHECFGFNTTAINVVTLNGTPNMVQSVSPYNGAEHQIFGSRLWPDYTGVVTAMSTPQTVQIGWGDYNYTTWAPQLSQIVLPNGQSKVNTAGIYDDGDVWYDSNNNGVWDSGELFHDMIAGVSNGTSFSLINFRGLEMGANECQTLAALSRNSFGKSPARRVVREHHNDTYPPQLNDVIVSPAAPATAYRRNAYKPTQIMIKAQTWSGDYAGSRAWSTYYNLKGDPASKVTLFNGQGVEKAIPLTSWTYLGKLAYEGLVDLSAVALPDATYRVQVRLEDNFLMLTDDGSRWFKMDNAYPSAAEMVPADGQLSNTFTSFNAKIVDPNLPDGTAGSGADIDVANPQIIPFRLLSLPSEVTTNNNTSWIFDLADGEAFATDHRGNKLLNGASVQIWTTSVGQYGSTTFAGTVSANLGNGKVTVDYPTKYTKSIFYVILYSVPFFTSNNGVDRVGAVPVSQITADGTYVTRVTTRDRAGNAGTFFTTSSPLEVPVGLITYTFDKPFLFTALSPPDVGTFTTSPVTTRKGNPVIDGQPLSLVQMPSTLTNLVPADANGIPGDGHQVLFGANGASSGSGQACFGLQMKSSAEGAVSVFGVIGMASGTSSPVPIYRIDAFSLTPQSATLEITPAVPNPFTQVTSDFLGKLGRAVPDGSLATFSTTFGTLFPDSDLVLPGTQSLALNGSASIMISASTKGAANISMQIGGQNNVTLVTFLDKYPPPAPANIISTPQYSNTGSTVVSWDASIDIGGAGTSQYQLEQSANGDAWMQVTAVATISATVSGLADGSYRYRVRAVDADGNIGAYSAISADMVVDTVAPPAVSCSDIGAGNNDPDEIFSCDPNIYFYFNPTDDRSGVGEVQIQVSITPDLTGMVEQPWIPTANFYLFTEGLGFKDYYARVRVKDKAGNIGLWGAWSNGIQVVMSGAVTPPNAPTITKIASKNAMPGIPVPTNLTSNIEVRGMSEASNLIQVYVNDVYLRSIISDSSGVFFTLINLAAGSHTVKVKAHNGFAESPFSSTISIVVDTALPVMSRTIYDSSAFIRSEYYMGTTTASDHRLTNIDFYLSDTGGSGYDITSAKATLTDIDDDGNILPAIVPYNNPVASKTLVISSDRVRLEPPAAWESCLQTGNRYRLAYQISDKAGNTRSYTFDFVIDNTKPGLAVGVPSPSTPPECNFKTIYVYNEEAYPWSVWPPVSALVPFTWNAASGAFMIDPAFNDPLLVDNTSDPPALLFNTPAIYGTLYEADRPQPVAKKGYDSRACTVAIAWGYSIAVAMGPDGLSNYKSFRFPFRTMVNGITSEKLVDQDWAICRNYFNIKFNVNSANAAPSPPTAVEFVNAGNTAIVYPVWLAYSSLYGADGGAIRHHDCIITDNSNDILVRVTVPSELFDQRIELVATDGAVITSANVSPNNTQAIIPLNMTAPSGTQVFQVRTFANGYYSTTQPRNVAYYYYRWIKGDTTPPITYDVYPTESCFNTLTGADARPFPSQISVKARDTSDGSNLSFINITVTGSSISFKNASGTALAGTLYSDYATSDMSYGFRFEPASTPTAEGTYNYELNLVDGARQTANSAVHVYPFKLDKTPPIPTIVNPGDGEVTNSLPSFNATVFDPNLADGSSGSGPNMDPSRAQIFPYKNLGQGVAAATSLTTTVYGIDTTATDHVNNTLPLNTEIWFAKLVAGKLEYPVTKGKITVNSADTIAAEYVSGTSLVNGATYAICYEIPNFPSNDGISKIAAVPVQPAIKGGSYVVFLKLIDNALNQGTYSSASSIYEAAFGTFTLTPSRTQLYVGLYPPHTANYVSDPILTTEGNPIKVGTEVTALTNRGSFTPADSNGIPGDGHQVAADASGVLYFGLQATGLSTGLANVRTVLGLASGTDSSVNFVQIPAFSATLGTTTLIIEPATPNPSTTCTTSVIGNAGDPVPNGTCINVISSLGILSPADAYALIDWHQVTTSSGQAAFSISSSNAGVASITIEIGGHMVNKQLTFIDRYPPTAPGKPMPDNVLNNNGAFNLLWVASTDPGNSGIAAYSVEYSLNGGAYTFLATSTAANFLTADLPQGVFTFRVRTVDGADNIGAYSLVSDAVEVDRTPPLGTIVVNGAALRTANPVVTLTLSASDAKGVADMSFSNDNITWSGWVSYATSISWTMSAGDGSKVVYVRYRDTVGNVGVFSDDIILDTTGPLGGVTIAPAPLSATTTLSLNLFANDGSGVPQMALAFDGGAFSAWQPFANYTWNVSTAFATHTVQVKYRDSLLNESAIFSATTCVDTTVPSTPVVTDDGEYSPFLDKLHATWSSSDLETGVTYYLVRVGTAQGLTDVAAEINVGNVTEYTFASLTLDLSGITQYYFGVYAVNGAGSMSLVGYSDGIKGGDPTPPDPFFITDEGDYTADKTKLSATWTASQDLDSGLNRYEFSAGTASGATDVVAWTSVGLALSYSATGLNLTHGQIFYINVRVYNNGGTYTPSYSNGIVVDLLTPPVPIMSAEPAYSSGTANLATCSIVVDTVSGGVTYDFQRATDAAFSAGLLSSDWQAGISYDFTGLVHGTTYYFRVRAKDLVGNVSSYSASVSSIQDSLAPPVPVMTVEPAYSPGTSNLASCLVVVDPVSGGVTYDFQSATDVAFSAGLVSSDWQAANGYAFTGLVDGTTYYFRVRAKDLIGNISSYSVAVSSIQDSLAPPVPAMTAEPAYTPGTSNLASCLVVVDPVSGGVAYDFQCATDAAFSVGLLSSGWQAANSYDFTGLVHGATYYFRVRAKDLVGNISSYSAVVSSIQDSLAPPVPVMSAEPTYSSGTANLATCSAVVDTVSGGVTYDFQLATDVAFPAGSLSSGWQAGNIYNFTDLVHGTTYYFRVRAKDLVGNISSYSAAVSSIQDSNPPTATNYTDDIPLLNNDPDHVWSRDTDVNFTATTLSDNGQSGVKNVYVQISDSDTFATILAESWLNNTTGAHIYTAPDVDGITIYARAKYEDVAGNISEWSATSTTDGISIDLTPPVAGATTDNVPGNDPNYVVSTDQNIDFGYTHSDAISEVTDVYLEIARDAAFSDLVKNEYIGGTSSPYTFASGVDGFTYFARIKVKDRAGWESTIGSYSDGIRVDMSPPDPQIQAFYINRRPGEDFGDTTTATSTVYITITLHDLSGIESAYISNDNSSWITWTNPAYPGSEYWDPASISWPLIPVVGSNTVYMKFEDGVGNLGSATQSIDYFSNSNVASGTRDDSVYPVDTYDEYTGQNKYGVDRTISQDANRGSSLKLVTP